MREMRDRLWTSAYASCEDLAEKKLTLDPEKCQILILDCLK